jgi:hypothetical protein
LLRFDEAAQWSAQSHEMVLAHDVVEAPRSQQIGQRSRLLEALGDGVVEERRS